MKLYILYISIICSNFTNCSQNTTQQNSCYQRCTKIYSIPSIVTFDPQQGLRPQISLDYSKSNPSQREKSQQKKPTPSQPQHTTQLIYNSQQSKTKPQRRPGFIVTKERQQALLNQLQHLKKFHNDTEQEHTTKKTISDPNTSQQLQQANNLHNAIYHQLLNRHREESLRKLLLLSPKTMKLLLDKAANKQLSPLDGISKQ